MKRRGWGTGPTGARQRTGRARNIGLVGMAVSVAVLVAACGSSGSPSSVPSAAIPTGTYDEQGVTVADVGALGPRSFTGPGPLAVGETTLTLPENGAPVEVWYPATKSSVAGRSEATYNVADWLPASFQKLIPAGFAVTYPSGGVRGVPVAPGRYPLVVFSHGYAGFRDQSTFLTARLASWGFVVAAPDHFSRDLTEVLGGPTSATAPTTDVQDLEHTISLMTHEDSEVGSPFHDRVDTGLIGAVGHSAGGAAVEALAAADPHVTTFIGLAGATVGSFGQTSTGPASKVPTQPGMLMAGTSDTVVKPDTIVSAYRRLSPPKRLILIRGAGHLVFSDLCEVGSKQGGLLSIASALHLQIPASLVPLASDGCKAPDLSPPVAWPVIRQAVTAQLRHVFGFDTSSKGLDGLAAAYPSVVASAQSRTAG
jgi:predicted dienelactone hydrolase